MACIISLYQCDNCAQIVSLKSREDWEKFEAEWFVGLKYEFCPNCRTRVATLARQLDDEDAMKFVLDHSSERVECVNNEVQINEFKIF